MIQDAGIFAKAAVAAKAIPELQRLLCLRRGDAGAAHGVSHRAEHRRPAEHRRQRAGDDFYCVLK